MSKRRKREYDFRVRKVPIGDTRLYNDVTTPYCTNCRGILILDRTNCTMRHEDPETDALSSCKELIHKRGPKFQYEDVIALKQLTIARARASVKVCRKKKKDKKQQKREALDRLAAKRKAEKAAKREAK